MASRYTSAQITGKQAAYLARLIAAVGKQKYQDEKRRLGFPTLTILQLTSRQASRLIDALQQEVSRQ